MLALVQAYPGGGDNMALVFQERLAVQFTLVDMVGNTTTRTYELVGIDPEVATVADVSDAAGALWLELDPLTLCNLVSYQVTAYTREDALVIPGAGVREDNASITVPLDGRPHLSHTFDIPAPAIAIFQATSGDGAKRVDPNDVDVLAFLDLFDAGTGTWMVSDGEHIENPTAANVKGVRAHKKSGRGQGS